MPHSSEVISSRPAPPSLSVRTTTYHLLAAANSLVHLAVGNAIGSSVFNLLGVLGLTASIKPLQAIDVSVLDGVILIAVSFAGLVLIARPAGIGRLQGGMLVATYTLYLFAAVAYQS